MSCPQERQDIQRRKIDHLEIVRKQPVGFDGLTTGFETYRFIHQALGGGRVILSLMSIAGHIRNLLPPIGPGMVLVKIPDVRMVWYIAASRRACLIRQEEIR